MPLYSLYKGVSSTDLWACPRCGAVVTYASIEAHDDWHDLLAAVPGMDADYDQA